MKNRIFLVLALIGALTHPLTTAFAQGTAFTYQGHLNDGATLANGTYDFQFAIFDAPTVGTQKGNLITNSATLVSNGLFTVTLDFGNQFLGAARWLEIGVRTNGAASFFTLSPRQALTPAPYAVFANSASNLLGTLPTAQLSGTAGAATNFTGSLNGDVTGIQNATTVSFVGGQSAASVSAVVGTVGAATSNATPNTIVKRDATGSFTATNVTLNGTLNLPAVSSRINSGTNQLLLVDSLTNFYTGPGAGNITGFGMGNTGVGYQALKFVSGGQQNTGIGFQALNSGNANFATAVGYQAMFLGGGSENTAIGNSALYNGGGNYNTAIGTVALYTNSTGVNNTAVGDDALMGNISGNANTAVGSGTLIANTLGALNVAIGFVALSSNTNGSRNIAIGRALESNTRGSDNIAIGHVAGDFLVAGSNNVVIGTSAGGLMTGGNNNIAIGYLAGDNLTTGGTNIDLGNQGVSTDTNTIRIGAGQSAAFIAGIYNATSAGGIPVYVNPNNQLGTLTSSARYKQNIQQMGNASEVLLALRPVTYQYKKEVDPQGLAQFGLIAEQVEKVDPDLVVHDQAHGIYTVRYDAVNAMLLNEFLKQHQKITGQNQEIQTLKQQNESLEKRLDALEKSYATQKQIEGVSP